MPIAKSAPQPPSSPIPQAQPQSIPQLINHEYHNVPLDYFRIFGVDFDKADDKTIQKLSDIHSWARDGVENLGEALQKVSKLSSNIGSSGFERQYEKVWRWVTLQRRINDLQKQQQAFERRF